MRWTNFSVLNWSLLLWFTRDSVRKYHRSCALTNRDVLSHFSGKVHNHDVGKMPMSGGLPAYLMIHGERCATLSSPWRSYGVFPSDMYVSLSQVFSFHKNTNHIGLEHILMTLSKISTSVVTLFLNQSCSGVLGIRVCPDQLWKGTFNSKSYGHLQLCSHHWFLHYKSFLCPSHY